MRNITEFGAFVELEEGIDGLIHVSDCQLDQEIKHPGEIVKKGDEVDAPRSSTSTPRTSACASA